MESQNPPTAETPKPFALACTHCGREIRFDIEDAQGLESFVERERDDARDEARAEDWEHPDLLEAQNRRWFMELAVAIRRGDRAEAEHLLDCIARELGDDFEEQVHQGRFSLRARQQEQSA